MELSIFQKDFLTNMGFMPDNHIFPITYSNPQQSDEGFLSFYEKKNAYLLLIGDYTIPNDFDLQFLTKESQIRFGIVYDGISNYSQPNMPSHTFYPSAFVAKEEKRQGWQHMKAGTHYKHIEIFIHDRYIQDSWLPFFPELSSLDALGRNSAALYLPFRAMDILRQLETYHTIGSITPLFLETKVMECLAYISHDLIDTAAIKPIVHRNTSVTASVNQLKSGYMGLSHHEIEAIQAAKDILSDNIANPPTVHALSQNLLITEKKLTDGFKHLHHLTIGHYIKELRITTAANLLTMTELSIEDISKRVGYSHPSNLSKAFKAKYYQTPLQYRKRSYR